MTACTVEALIAQVAEMTTNERAAWISQVCPAGSAPLHCPIRICEAHEVHPVHPGDGDWEQLRRREVRNALIVSQLKAGRTVQYRSTGWSMWPFVHDGDCCLFEPVFDCSQLRPEWDVVFCLVQPTNLYYAHLVHSIETVQDDSAGSANKSRLRFWISNREGHVHGWCYDEHIYGRLIEVVE